MGDQHVAGLAARAIKIAEDAQRTQNDIVETQKTQATTQAGIVAQQAKAKWLLRIALTGLVADILLSVFMLFLYNELHASQLRACAIGNGFRAGQIQVWDHVLAISKGPPGETAAERTARLAKLARFHAYIRARNKPVDCKSLYGPR